MNITLPPELEKLIEQRVDSGKYQTPQDVLAAAVISLDQQEALAGLASAELELLYPGFHEKIAQGVAEADAGKLSDGEEFFAELERAEQERAGNGRKTA